MEAAKKRKGSYSVGLATRESILTMSAEMMAEVGYHAMSLRDLARRVGISHPAVIYHFPNKESMIRAVVMRMEDQFDIVEYERNEFDGDLKPARLKVETLADLCMKIMALTLQPNAARLLALSAVIEHEAGVFTHPMHEYMRERRRMIEEFVVNSISSKQEENSMQLMVFPPFIARNLCLMWVGIKQSARVEGAQVDALELISHFLATCLIDLKVPPDALQEFAHNIPHELAPAYLRVIHDVNRYLA